MHAWCMYVIYVIILLFSFHFVLYMMVVWRLSIFLIKFLHFSEGASFTDSVKSRIFLVNLAYSVYRQLIHRNNKAISGVPVLWQ